MRFRHLLLVGLLSLAGWSQPSGEISPSSTPTAQADQHDQHDEEHEGEPEHHHHEEDGHSSTPHASDESRPAIFNQWIGANKAERAGIPISYIVRASVMPWTLSALVFPFYWRLARRKGLLS